MEQGNRISPQRMADALLALLLSTDPPADMAAAAKCVDLLCDTLYFSFNRLPFDAITPETADLIIYCSDLGLPRFPASVDEIMSE